MTSTTPSKRRESSILSPVRQSIGGKIIHNIALSTQCQQDDSASERIRVAIRLRPLNEREISQGQIAAFNISGNTVQYPSDPKHNTTVDAVFDEQSTNDMIYDAMARKIVKGAVEGVNGTIFACKSKIIIVQLE